MALIPLPSTRSKDFEAIEGRGLGILITDHNVRETLKLVDQACIIHQVEFYVREAQILAEDPKAEVYLGEFNL